MIYEQDWLMRQIKTMTNLIFRALLNKPENPEYVIEEIDIKKVEDDLNDFLKDQDIDGAEDYLFANLDKGDSKYLKIGLRFYEKLNEFSEERLEELNFSREEVKLGLIDLIEFYGYGYMSVFDD